jgi:NRPS condensation-like uncharacterized protein
MRDIGLDWIHPLTPVPGESRWALRPIDAYAVRWVIQGTWIFQSRLDATALKHALARVLVHYPKLCGRVSPGGAIRFSGTGIPFLESSDARLSSTDFNESWVDAAPFARRLQPTKIRLGLDPLLSASLTHIRDGSVLAICCSHACLDGSSFYRFASNLTRCATNRSFAAPDFHRETSGLRS